MIAVDPPDAVVLDLRLPDIDGIEVCRRVRTWSNVPIIILSADGLDERKVQALDEGANDYVTKPYSTPELLARLRAVMRSTSTSSSTAEDGVLVVGDLRIDLARRTVMVGDRVVDFTPKEFGFLAILARYPGRVLTHSTILREVWGPNYGSETQYLRVYAGQIRKKLDDDIRNPRLVTELGVGYRLQARRLTTLTADAMMPSPVRGEGIIFNGPGDGGRPLRDEARARHVSDQGFPDVGQGLWGWSL